MRDVVVLLPGITGSVLQKEGRDVWALSGAGVVSALRTLGRSLDALKLDDDPPGLDDLGDGVTADRLIDDVHLIPALWKIDGYTKVAQRIEREFDVTPGRNFFPFPYDWRRDNRVAARRLARLSHEWLAKWRREGYADAKLVLLAHSMGGLVARYFLECLEGWRLTRTLITFGTPYRGSLNALDFLANGMTKRIAGVPIVDLTALLRSFTSVYQLLPIYECYDGGDGRLTRVAETASIPGVDHVRAAAALAFHREIEDAVTAHQKQEAYAHGGAYAIHPVVGTYQRTLQSAKLENGVVAMQTEHPRFPPSLVDGDGTVPRPSATPIELSGMGSEMFVAQVHGSLQNSDPVLDQIAGILSSLPDAELHALRGGGARLSLEVDDAYVTKQPIELRVGCEVPDAAVRVTVVDAATGRRRAQQRIARVGERRTVEIPPLPEGTYRVTVEAADAAGAVADVFIVAAA